MTTRNFFRFIFSLALPMMAGVIGSVFTAASVSSWYVTLIKPELAPPNWVFGPVWTLLYILMGIALFLVWKKGTNTPGVKAAVAVFLVQITLNALWSYFFFGLRDLRLAFIELVLLWLFILTNIVVFARVSRTAAWLLVPYIGWVTFAGYLNFALLVANGTRLAF